MCRTLLLLHFWTTRESVWVWEVEVEAEVYLLRGQARKIFKHCLVLSRQ